MRRPEGLLANSTRRKPMTFRSVLLLHFALGAVVPVVLLGWTTVVTATIGIRDLAIRDIEQNVEKAAELVDRELTAMLEAYKTFNLFYAHGTYPRTGSEPVSEAVASDRRLQRLISGVVRSFQLRGARLFLDRNAQPLLRPDSSSLHPLESVSLHLAEFNGTTGSRQVVWAGPYRSKLTSGVAETIEQFSLSGPLLVSSAPFERHGWIVLDKNPERLRSLLASITTDYGGLAAVVDDQNRIVFSPNADEFAARFLNQPRLADGRNRGPVFRDGFYVVTRALQANGWMLYSALPQSFIVREGVRVSRFGALALLLSTALAAFLLRSFSRYVGRRLDPILSAIEAGPISDTILLPELPVHGSADRPDEIDRLAYSYNDLRSRLDHLVDRVYRAEQESLRQRLSALQSQIDPHFIYNTLEGVQSNILLSRPDVAIRIVRELSRLLRSGLSNGADELKLQDEVDMVRRFLSLEELIYSGSYQLDVAIPKALLNTKLTKFTLQPIVENSVVHGFRDVPSGSLRHISICAETVESRVRIVVADNGSGLGPEATERLNTILSLSQPSTEAFGLSNVHARLRLRYGDSAGLSVCGSQAGGFQVSVWVPGGAR